MTKFNLKMVIFMLFLIITISPAFVNGQDAQDNSSEETVNVEETEGANEDKGSGNKISVIYLMEVVKGFKVVSYVITILIVLVFIIMARKSAKKRISKGKSDSGILFSRYLIGLLVLLIVVWLGLFFLGSSMEVLQVDVIQNAMETHSPEQKTVIEKTYSIGIGPFYLSHTFDIVLLYSILYFLGIFITQRIFDR